MILDQIGQPFRPGPPRGSVPRRAAAYGLGPKEERYTVQGGGAALIEIKAGDRLVVRNTEGGQICEVLAAHRDGRCDPAILGAAGNAQGAGVRAALADMPRLQAGLVQRDINVSSAQTLQIFSSNHPRALRKVLLSKLMAGF